MVHLAKANSFYKMFVKEFTTSGWQDPFGLPGGVAEG